MKHNIITSLLLLTISLQGFSQKREFEFKNYTQDDGLPSNESYFVYRDSRDFLWIATDQGVVRFNGSRMERFNLPDNVVFKIREDSKGRIWFFSHTGKLAFFFNEAVHSYPFNDSILGATNSMLITDAYVNEMDEIILNSGRYENYKVLKNGQVESYSYASADKADSSRLEIFPVNGQRFFSQKKMLNPLQKKPVAIVMHWPGKTITYQVPILSGESPQYGCTKGKGNSVYFFLGKTLAKLNDDGSFKIRNFPSVIGAIAVGNQVWAGFVKTGLVMMNEDLEDLHSYPILADKTITSINTDHEGGTWFSTLDNGVYYLKNPLIRRYAGHPALNGIVSRIFPSTHNNLLLAGPAGLYDLSGENLKLVLEKNSLKTTDLFEDNQSNIFMAGAFDLSGRNGKREKSRDRFYKNVFLLNSSSELVAVPGGQYLMCNYDGILKFSPQQFDKDERAGINFTWIIDNAAPRAATVFCDAAQQVWLGSINALYKLDTVSNLPQRFRVNDPLFQKGITFMRQLPNGIYAIGIRFGGIALLKDSNLVANITEQDGLLSNSVKYLLPVNDQLWVATARGISIIHFLSFNPVVKYEIKNIGKNQGLYNLIINQLMVYKNSILAATSKGIYEISDTAKFLAHVPDPVPFYITSIRYYKGDTSKINSVTLPFSNNRILIRYSAICFNLPEDLKYYYRLDKKDAGWHETASPELLLENLIPGTYQLELMAMVKTDRRVSAIQRMEIIVEKPWWQHPLPWILLLLLLSLLLYFLVKRRIARITLREKINSTLKSKMMELEQTALRSQMNPHFIFNCLTSIQQLVVTGNKTEANEYLVKFARLMRQTLELSGRSNVTVEDEINYLQEYVSMEQLRMPGKFDFFIRVDPSINKPQTEIPNMILQPIIENSIRHGIRHLENKKGWIRLELIKKAGYICCTITDNGTGIKPGDPGQKQPKKDQREHGMTMVKKRLEVLAGEHFRPRMLEAEQLVNEDGSIAGTRITLQIPFKSRLS